MKPRINLEIRSHRGEKQLFLHFLYRDDLIQKAKSIGCHWSSTYKAWYFKYTYENLNTVIECYKNLVHINQDRIKGHIKTNRKVQKARKTKSNAKKTGPEQVKYLRRFREYLQSNRYSAKTVDSYLKAVGSFLGFYHEKHPGSISMTDLHYYNYEVIIKNDFSVSYQRQFIGALKLFYTYIVKAEIKPERLERPKKERRLPEVLSTEEVKKILTNTTNIKHKTILSTLYSSGLRISELLNLKIGDIDSSRMLIRVVMAKGRKDRYVKLPEALLYLLQVYYRKYTPRKYLFEGMDGGRYSPVSVRKILRYACEKSGIRKRVTPHTLRHSYATHLLELGVDLRYVQAFLGHQRPETTMIYTHVSTQKIQDMINPFDELAKEEMEKLRDRNTLLPSKDAPTPDNKRNK